MSEPIYTIGDLPPTNSPALGHEFPAMKDGLTVKLSVDQIRGLIAEIYDPQAIADDAFDRGNHTGEQDPSTVTGLTEKLAELAMGRRNLWVNGSFQVSQKEGNGLGTANGFQPADQIGLFFTAATAAVSVQRVQARSLANALDQIEFKCTTAKAVLAAGDFVTLTQNIEGSAFAAAGFGTAVAVPLVTRFEVKLPAGLYHCAFHNSAANRHCSVPFTIAGGEANTAVVKEIIVPPDTAGTWLTGDGVIGITCDLVLAAGSAKTGGAASTWGGTAYLAASAQKNILDSASNVARLADVGLKLDPDAAGVYGAYEVGEVDPVYRSERYYEKRSGDRWPAGSVNAAGNAIINEAYKHVKCKVPSITLGTSKWWNQSTGAFAAGTSGASTPRNDAVAYTVNVGTSIDYYSVIAYSDWSADARLS